MKTLLFLLLLIPTVVFSQSVEISYGENPLVINPLLGSNLIINYTYTSETGASGNHLYIGLEILDENNNYIATVVETTLENQISGESKEGNVSLFLGSSNKTSEELPAGYYYQAKAILYASGSWIANAWANHSNTPALNIQKDTTFTFSTNTIAKGADISWMTEMEAAGFIWKDNDGNTKELLPLLKEYQLNAVRLRVWVNPENSDANGWCDIDDLVKKAVLANEQNMDIMICIHYSDHWADPGKQIKPAAWSGFSIPELETAVTNHTTNILTALNAKGITPKWMQIGNETSNGMLWPTGKASTGGFDNYAKFINAGLNAVKNYNTAIKTILHIANGEDNALFRWNIDGLINNGLEIDKLNIIGMSLYPDENDWKTKVDATYSNMLDIKSRYNKDVMMAEVGFDSNLKDISHQFLTYIIEKTRQASGLGVFYWEAIAQSPFTNYNKGAWDNDGSPSIAMDAFIDQNTLNTKHIENLNKNIFKIFPNPSSDSITISNSKNILKSVLIYDVKGRLVKKIKSKKMPQTFSISSLKAGIYIMKINDQSLKFLKI